MRTRTRPAAVRALPEDVANKIAAGEVVERPASVVKELVENALDAGATRIQVRLVAAGRRTIEVTDNGSGMSEQDALLAVERHTTSKIRQADDLDNIQSFGFRGEALASIAAVSRFEVVTRRERDESATRLRIEGGVLRDVSQAAAPVGTRVTVNRLYFNTPVRAKFLKGITTELGQCIDCVQRYALVSEGVSFQLLHNDKPLLDVPANADLRARVALIWGLSFVRDLVDLSGEAGGMRFSGLLGTPNLTRSSRSHQFFFINGRPVVNRALQYGLEYGYQQLLTVGRRPVAIAMIEIPPRAVDINIHPAKREVRFRDERAAQQAIQQVVRGSLGKIISSATRTAHETAQAPEPTVATTRTPTFGDSQDAREAQSAPSAAPDAPPPADPVAPETGPARGPSDRGSDDAIVARPEPGQNDFEAPGVQTEFVAPQRGMGGDDGNADADDAPAGVYHAFDEFGGTPMQVFDTYLIVPDDDRLLFIDQHALHERLTYDALYAELRDSDYAAQQLVAPIVFDVPPSYVKTLESNRDLFSRIGIEIEPFGPNTFQVTAVCHLYDDARISDTIFRVLDQLVQGELFTREEVMDDLLRLAVEACRGSVKAGDRLTPEERKGLLDGFRRLRPPYTCPHGRPIIIELTLSQMEKSFRRRQ